LDRYLLISIAGNLDVSPPVQRETKRPSLIAVAFANAKSEKGYRPTNRLILFEYLNTFPAFLPIYEAEWAVLSGSCSRKRAAFCR
jgi:hypothetical protein